MQVAILAVIFIASFLIGCKPDAPDVTLCAILPDKVVCFPNDPNDPNEPDIELTFDEALGYQCMSPDDAAEAKKYVNELEKYIDEQCNRAD